MVSNEHANFKEQVNELLRKGFTWKSKSLFVALALLVVKKDESWRMFMTGRAINCITIKYRFLFPTLHYMLDPLESARVFSKIRVTWYSLMWHYRMISIWDICWIAFIIIRYVRCYCEILTCKKHCFMAMNFATFR